MSKKIITAAVLVFIIVLLGLYFLPIKESIKGKDFLRAYFWWQGYGDGKMLSEADILKLKEKISDLKGLSQSQGELYSGKVVGVDSRNGEKIVLVNACIDVCPEPIIRLRYAAVKNESDCLEISGEPVMDGGWPAPADFEGKFFTGCSIK